MERRNRDRERDRDRYRDRRRNDDNHHRSDRRRDRSRSRRRSTSRSRKSTSRSRNDRDRSRSKSRHERRRSRSNSSNRRRRSSPRSRSKKESRGDGEHRKNTPPPPCISIIEPLPYTSASRKDMQSEKAKQPSPDMITQMEKHNKKPGAYCNLKLDEPIDKEKIHKEIEEKLRETLAREGIEYNAPKPEASHPVFANDGSFLEIFKKMQEAQQETQTEPQVQQPSTSYAPPAMLPVTNTVPRPQLPIFGRRRGGKILKTGVVAKPKNADNDANTDPKDFWSIYLREVNKYKNAACDSDAQSRPLVK